jgi:ribosomal protein L11 methyltransferase
MTSKSSNPCTASVASLETDEQSARRIAVLVDEGCCGEAVAVGLVDNGGGSWRLTIHVRAKPDEKAARNLLAAAAGRAAAQRLYFKRVEPTDWVRASLAGLVPVAAGRFIVHGAHDRARILGNRIGIEIEAALAFGTGHHGTTRGCLLALDRICKSLKKTKMTPFPLTFTRRRGRLPGKDAKRRRHILDLGTGSGVLAIAAARALRRRVLATDIDANALRVARVNIRRNRVGPMVEAVNADGVATPRLHAHAPFDLVFANILLGPLRHLASSLRRLTVPGARIVLSGLLRSQANAAIAAYRPLALERRIELDDWTTLVFARQPRRRADVARRRSRS